jgi:ABC-2 type transport system permease protein
MAELPEAYQPRPLLGLLFRVKARSVFNRLRQAVDEAPVRVAAAMLLIGLIWLGLYWLFWIVFHQFRRTPLEATVAIPLIFNFFFVAMLALLMLSNAIIAYGALFGKDESAYLLTSPLTPLDVVTLKYVESLGLSSWSLIVLGLPLMMAMARHVEAPIFYLLFIAFFLAFIPIPGALGMLLAWAAARFFPRRLVCVLALVGGALIAGFVVWGMHSLRLGDTAAEVWLRSFLARMSFVQSTFLPNHWVAMGIDHALHDQFYESGMYLCVTVANALFLSWIAVMIVSRYFDGAHDHAAAGRGSELRKAAHASGGLAGLVFFYLPRPLRLVAAKDLRIFSRDPLQWSQLVILFGLLILYLSNLPSLRLDVAGSIWTLIAPFLNLCAISLILATFTCRFVFPLASLEGRKLWLVGLLPMPRGHLLLAKLAFAMTVTLLGALGAMGLAVVMLDLNLIWAVAHLGVTVAICFGLCGFSVGIGARLPMFNEPNVASIANGLGGTTNLLASLALIAVVLTCMGFATWRSRYMPEDTPPDTIALAWCLGAAVISIAAGTALLIIGARHFNRVEV